MNGDQRKYAANRRRDYPILFERKPPDVHGPAILRMLLLRPRPIVMRISRGYKKVREATTS